jgi:thiosulfate/3-mercaptopyruvate sulfurtransferase
MSYAHPDVLVDTAWVEAHREDPDVRLLEVNEDVLVYDTGHIPGAVRVDWRNDLWKPNARDFIEGRDFAELMERLGISNDTTVITYGDRNNWWATYALWVLQYNGHRKIRLMNGGRKKWEEEGRPLVTEVPVVAPGSYTPQYRDQSIRAYSADVFRQLLALREGTGALVDVRSPGEFTGDVTFLTEFPLEGTLSPGHVPGAKNVPWAQAANADGTYKSVDELRKLYEPLGITPDKDVIVYCRIGERSSHTWFALKYLLGYDRVRNYDGGSTEWGNLVGVPVVAGAA